MFDFDYRDESAPEPPEKVSVSWLFANCWYIAHGESPDGKYEGTYPAQLVEDTIGRYFPFPPEELRRFANSEERDVIRYSGGEYRLARGFGGGGAYMAASGYSSASMAAISRQMAQVYFLSLVSFFTRLAAISTRKPSQPLSSQNRITSLMASTVARGPGASVGCCQGSRQVP